MRELSRSGNSSTAVTTYGLYTVRRRAAVGEGVRELS